MKLLKFLKQIVTNLYFLLFVTGFLCAAFITCHLQDDYENRVFVALTKSITGNTPNPLPQDQLIKKALNTTYYLLSRRSITFKDGPTGGFLDDFVHPLSADLMTADGACGSYSAILCRLLGTMGFETHFTQMMVNGHYGGHIVAEVKTDHGWVVLDPLYNLVFINPRGLTASFEEVSANWQWFKKQVPENYNFQYRYEGARRTNWDKIPVVMPLVKKSLSCFMAKDKLEHLSLRSYCLRKYEIGANLLLLLIVLISVVIIRKLRRLNPNKRPRMYVGYKNRSAIVHPQYANA